MIFRIFKIVLLFCIVSYVQIKAQDERSIYYKYYNPTLLDWNQAISGITIPNDIKNTIELVNIKYLGFDNHIYLGQMLVDSRLSDEIKLIFEELLSLGFHIEKIVPISRYNWSDDLSMEDNNSSCFNYRTIDGSSKLSLHAYGRAIDINPRVNPYFKGGNISPKNGKYVSGAIGTIEANSAIVLIFHKYGWKWGGDWVNSRDYQHFYKEF